MKEIENICDNEIQKSYAECAKKLKEKIMKKVQKLVVAPKKSGNKEIHSTVTCDKCGTFPIVGIRYKCMDCPNFDLCEKCEESKYLEHEHNFLKIRKPLQNSGDIYKVIDIDISQIPINLENLKRPLIAEEIRNLIMFEEPVFQQSEFDPLETVASETSTTKGENINAFNDINELIETNQVVVENQVVFDEEVIKDHIKLLKESFFLNDTFTDEQLREVLIESKLNVEDAICLLFK